MACYCAGSKSQLIRLLYVQMYSKSRSGRKWVKGLSVLWTALNMFHELRSTYMYLYAFYDALLLIVLRQREPEASSLSCKGFIRHVSMEHVQNIINLVLIIIIPPMFLSVLSSLDGKPPDPGSNPSPPAPVIFCLVCSRCRWWFGCGYSLHLWFIYVHMHSWV